MMSRSTEILEEGGGEITQGMNKLKTFNSLYLNRYNSVHLRDACKNSHSIAITIINTMYDSSMMLINTSTLEIYHISFLFVNFYETKTTILIFCTMFLFWLLTLFEYLFGMGPFLPNNFPH